MHDIWKWFTEVRPLIKTDSVLLETSPATLVLLTLIIIVLRACQ